MPPRITKRIAKPAPVAPIAAPTKLNIVIDRDAFTFADLKLFAASEAGTANEDDVLALLDRCVVGGLDPLPLTAMPQIVEALMQAIGEIRNPKN